LGDEVLWAVLFDEKRNKLEEKICLPDVFMVILMLNFCKDMFSVDK